MPSSRVEKIPFVVGQMMHFKPKSLLDVGCGFGKYGFLAREYLELWDPFHGSQNATALSRKNWVVRIVGVDAYPPAIQEHHKLIYNQIIIGDVTKMLDKLKGFDLVLLCDVLEHMDKKIGLIMLRSFLKSAKHLVVTIPNGFTKQKATFGNPYEVHKCGWEALELKREGLNVVIENKRFVCASR